MISIKSLITKFSGIMKKTIISIILMLLFVLTIKAQYQNEDNTSDDYYTNPIFRGDYPDPSILVDDDDYYMIHSSFDYYPGLLIWHSKDLINWAPVTNALYKYVGAVWAPDLAKYKDKYYIYFPANNTNYVVVADSIQGPWSDPIDLKIGNIDPGHVADDDGNRYLYFSSGGYVPLSEDGLSVIGGFKHTYDGWPIPRDWSIEGFFMEGPKMAKRGEYYYLTVAEGGTAGPPTGHMVISARSKSPLGPWENSPYNPVIRTKKKSERWWSKGHGTLFEDASGKWWMIYHAYENGFLNMGRQTLLEPVEWTNDGWYKIPDNIKNGESIKRPVVKSAESIYTLSDNFDGNELKPHWKFFGEYDTSRFSMENNELVLKAEGQSVGETSPLLCVPSDHSYTAEVELTIEGKATGGLMLFYNSDYHSGVLAGNGNIFANLRGWQFPTERKVIKNHVYLKLRNINNTVDMYYSTDGIKWNKIENSAEVSGFNHNALSGFISLRLGLCAIGEGSVKFNDFIYNPIKSED